MHNATGDNQSDGGSDTFYDALDDEPDSFSSLSPPVDTVAKNGIRPNAWAKPGSSLSTNASDRYLAAFPPPSAQLQRSPASSLSSSGPPSHNLYRPAAQYTQTSASTPNPYPPRAEELAQRVLGRSRTPATAGSMTSENRNLFPGTSSKVPQQEEAESSRHAQSLWRREQRYGLSSVTVRDLSSPTSPFNAPSSSGGTPPSIYARVNKAHVKRGRKGWASIEPPIAGTSEATGSHQGNSAFGSDGPEKTVDAAAAAASSTNHASAQIPRVLSADTRHSTPDPDFESDPELENLSVFTPVSSTRADPCSPQHFSALIDRIMECTEHAALNEGETDAALAPLLHALRSTFSSRSALVRCFLGSEHSKGMCSHNDQSVATSVRRKGKSRQKDEDVAESSANVTTASKTQEFSYDVEKSHAPGFGQDCAYNLSTIRSLVKRIDVLPKLQREACEDAMLEGAVELVRSHAETTADSDVTWMLLLLELPVLHTAALNARETLSLLLRCIIRQPLDAQDRAVQRLRDGSDDAYPRDAFATLVQRATAFAGWRIACCLRGEQEEDDSASHHQSTSSAPFTKSALPRAAPSVAETTTQGKKKNRGVPRSDLRSDHYSADWRLRTAARFLSLLYAANDEGAVQRGATTAAREPLSIATFYVTLADTLPVVNDYQIWEQNRNTSNKGAFTLCRYPFLLSLGSKTRILAFDAESQMEAQARQAFYNSLYAGKLTNQHPEQQAQLRIQVRRSALVADSLRELSAANTQLKKALRVEFVGEEGLDAGGPRREWLLLLTRALFTPAYGMFRYDDDAPGGVGYFNPASQENAESFALLGSVIGLALYHQIVLDPPLPSALFKLLLHRPVGLRDLAEVRPALARGLQQLLDWDEERDGGSVEDVFARDWVGSYDSFGTEVREPLVPGGDMLSVSASNREDYVARLVQWVLVDSVHTQLDAFREGFVRVLGGPTVTLFAPEELELLTRGSAEPLDLRELRGVTRYEGTTDSDQLIEAFWSYWDALPVDAQRALLAFATGTDRVPATGIATVIFRLHAATPDDSDLLPWSSTCTSTLFLPRYADEAKMRSKLAQAVSLSRGFGLR